MSGLVGAVILPTGLTKGATKTYTVTDAVATWNLIVTRIDAYFNHTLDFYTGGDIWKITLGEVQPIPVPPPHLHGGIKKIHVRGQNYAAGMQFVANAGDTVHVELESMIVVDAIAV